MPKKQYRLDKPKGCDIDGCGRPHHSNGLCVPHWTRRQDYGDPLAGPPLRKPRSDAGRPRGHYSGDKVDEYHVNHKNVREARGPAWQHDCEHCGKQAAQWATVKGTAGEGPEDFVPLCVRCHALYDDFASRLVRPAGETHHSAKLTEDQVREIKARGSENRSALAREFGVTYSLIYSIHVGLIWKAAGGPEPPAAGRTRPRGPEQSVEPGQRFGKLVVTGPVTREAGGRKRKTVQCLCDCGTSKVARLENLLYGNTKSCGCLRTEAGLDNRRLTVEPGQRFGRGVVLESDLRVNNRRSVRLRCDCGREYVTVIYAMLNGATVSCGCRSKETQIGRGERGEDHARSEHVA
jgi:hypothetical protein